MSVVLSVLDSPIISVASVLLALAGISLACFFYRRGQRTKIPCWAIRSTTLIEGYGSSLEDLRITYKQHLVEDLSVSRIVFWNDGRETIDGGDIAAANLLRVATRDDLSILDAKVVGSNNPSSCFSVSLDQDGKSAAMGFDYLDQGQGAVVQIVHTGTSSDDLWLGGDIKGSRSLRKKDIRVLSHLPLPTTAEFNKRIGPKSRRRIRAVVYCVMGLYPLVLVGTLLLMTRTEPLFPRAGTARDESTMSIVMVATVAAALVLSVLTFWRAITYWRSQFPSGLESFEEDIVPG